MSDTCTTCISIYDTCICIMYTYMYIHVYVYAELLCLFARDWGAA